MRNKATRVLISNNYERIATQEKQSFSVPRKLKIFAESKRSQITIWIIVSIVLVALIALLFLLKIETIKEIFTPGMPDSQSYIEQCVKNSLTEAIDIMLPQAGFISPMNYKLYKDNKIAYLCYNKNYYQPCINQVPLYIQSLEQEIKNYIAGKIKDCFFKLKQDYQDKRYEINEGPLYLQVNLAPKQVRVEIDKKFELTKQEETKRYNEFKVKLNSPLYDLAVIAQEIVNQEAKFCYFEYLGFQLLYPAYSIEKTDINGEVKIYQIKEKSSGKQLNFAVRSCAMPAGL